MDIHHFVFNDEAYARRVESIVATKLSRLHNLMRRPFRTHCSMHAGKTHLVIEIDDVISKGIVRSIVLAAVQTLGTQCSKTSGIEN